MDGLAGLWVTLLTIGMALGMDAFSLGIGLGARGLRWRDVGRLTVLVAIMHVILPLVGIWLGDLLYLRFGGIIQKVAAIILMFLGAKMALEAWRREDIKVQVPISANLFALGVLAFSVSVDSLSVGFTLGTFRIHPFIPSLLFGAMSGTLSLTGLFLGKKVNLWLGSIGQVAGGAVLALLGLKLMY